MVCAGYLTQNQSRVPCKGPYQIARTLIDERVTRPSAYIALRDGRTYTPSAPEDSCRWGSVTVKNILAHSEYMECTVNFRTPLSFVCDNVLL
jgi:hypothetical protein